MSAEGALLEALWILMKGVQLAFTDWIPNEPLNPDDARLMWDGMAIHPLRSRSASIIVSAAFTRFLKSHRSVVARN